MPAERFPWYITVISRPSPGTTTLHHNHLIKNHVTSASPESVPPSTNSIYSTCSSHPQSQQLPLRKEKPAYQPGRHQQAFSNDARLADCHGRTNLRSEWEVHAGIFQGNIDTLVSNRTSRDSTPPLAQRTPSRLKNPKDSTPRVFPEERDGRAAPCFEPPGCRRPALGRYETSADSIQRTSETSSPRPSDMW